MGVSVISKRWEQQSTRRGSWRQKPNPVAAMAGGIAGINGVMQQRWSREGQGSTERAFGVILRSSHQPCPSRQ